MCGLLLSHTWVYLFTHMTYLRTYSPTHTHSPGATMLLVLLVLALPLDCFVKTSEASWTKDLAGWTYHTSYSIR